MKTRLLLSALAVFSFSIGSLGQYCTTGLYGSGCQWGDDLASFTLGTISTSGPCTTGSVGYVDNTSMSTNLLPGNTYPFTATTNYSCCEHFAIWADFNNDNDFDDAGELLWSSSTSGTSWSGNITIPFTPGTFRLRARVKFAGGPMTATDACTYFSYGEVEDYTIVVDYLSPNDAGIAVIDTPLVPACALGNNVWATLTNYGSDTLTSATINWEHNGTPQTPIAWTGSLASFSSEIVQLGTTTILDGDDLKVWTSMPNGAPESPGAEVNDTIAQTVKVGLSGTYFITCLGLPGSYANFNAAVADLVNFGVCGPVTFIVDNCVYNEQVVIPEIQNASATNNIVFRSVNSAPAGCELTFTPSGPTDNYTLHFDGADHISFEQITISTGASGSYNGKVIVFDGGAHHNKIDSCLVLGDPATTSTWSSDVAVISSDADIDSSNVFNGNLINGGSYGFYWWGNSTSALEPNTVITNNTIEDYYYGGMYMYYQDGVDIIGNHINPLAPGYTWNNYNMELYYCMNDIQISHNQMDNDQDGTGITLYECSALASEPGLLFNNSIALGDSTYGNGSTGIQVSYCSNQLIHSNSVYLMPGATYSEGMYIYGGFNNKLFNNNLYVEGNAPALFFDGGVTESDYNNFYTTAGSNLIDFGGLPQATLTDWQNATGFDMHSYSVNPLYVSISDLSTCNDTLDNAGMSSSYIVDDFNGNPRSTNFDVGAIEFDGISSFTLGADTNICNGTTLVLGNANSTSSWLWNTTATTNTINVTAAGTYTAQITSVCGIGTAAIDVGIEPDPIASFTHNDIFLGVQFTNTSANATTYHWDFGDGDTSNLQDPDHVYDAGGVYTVTLTVTGPCGTVSYTEQIEVGVVGVEEHEFVFNIIPNPATDAVRIESSEVMNGGTVEIIDATGRVVFSTNQSGQIMNINVETFESGTYFVRITNEDKFGVQKLIVR